MACRLNGRTLRTSPWARSGSVMAEKPLVAYYRVSTQKQGDFGLGPDAQVTASDVHASDALILPAYQEFESGMRADRLADVFARPCAGVAAEPGVRRTGSFRLWHRLSPGVLRTLESAAPPPGKP